MDTEMNQWVETFINYQPAIDADAEFFKQGGDRLTYLRKAAESFVMFHKDCPMGTNQLAHAYLDNKKV